MKVIKCKLDSDSIGKAIEEIEAYQDEFSRKLESFMDALLSVGFTEASVRASSFMGDSEPASVTKEYIVKSKDTLIATISLVGKDAIFIEFGSGIQFNPVDHPLAGKLHYGPGTYPHQTHVPIPGFWYYGGGKLSVGTEAKMPIYYAGEEIRNNAVQKALEIFRS